MMPMSDTSIKAIIIGKVFSRLQDGSFEQTGKDNTSNILLPSYFFHGL